MDSTQGSKPPGKPSSNKLNKGPAPQGMPLPGPSLKDRRANAISQQRMWAQVAAHPDLSPAAAAWARDASRSWAAANTLLTKAIAYQASLGGNDKRNDGAEPHGTGTNDVDVSSPIAFRNPGADLSAPSRQQLLADVPNANLNEMISRNNENSALKVDRRDARSEVGDYANIEQALATTVHDGILQGDGTKLIAILLFLCFLWTFWPLAILFAAIYLLERIYRVWQDS